MRGGRAQPPVARPHAATCHERACGCPRELEAGLPAPVQQVRIVERGDQREACIDARGFRIARQVTLRATQRGSPTA